MSSRSAVVVLLALGLGACATTGDTPYDYSAFRQRPPRSILVLPPLNETTSVEATYSYLASVTKPLAERGYYVFPVAMVDQFLRDNGLPTAGEMHQAPLDKLLEQFGADAVLYPTIEEYGSKYQLVNAVAIVRVKASLLDARTGTILWEGKGKATEDSGTSGDPLIDLVAAAVTQVINSVTDPAHDLCETANEDMFFNEKRGLPVGPYRPEFVREP
jgi:hypothetical protein